MKVKLYRGRAKPQYTLYLAADKRIEDLSETAQEAIKAIGELKEIGEEDLAQGKGALNAEIMERVKAEGAHFVKTVVEFREMVVGSSGHGKHTT